MPQSTVLVVDKEKILVDLLVPALSSDDLDVFGATSTEDALRLLEMHAPALVVLDPTIPGGFNLVEAVVESKAKAVVMSDSPDIAERVLMFGIHDVVKRTAPLETIIDVIHGALDLSVQPRADAGGTRVLVTDDEDEVRTVLSEFLVTKGYDVRSATNGEEAVKAVNEDPSLGLVLLDIKMPQMGGMEALGHIMARENPPTVIMMTAVADPEVSGQALKTGACDYILKPFDFALIDSSITACLSQKELHKQPWWKRLARGN